jgi:Bacterial Ig-like domain
MTVKRYTINGTKLSLPIHKNDIVTVRLIDTDLVITTRDKVQHTLQNAAMTAMSQPTFFVEFKDGRASGQQLIQQVGKTQQTKVSAATVKSQDVALPEVIEEAQAFQVTVQRTEGTGLRVQEPISVAPLQATPSPPSLTEGQKSAISNSPVTHQGASFLAKFLGWTGLGLGLAGVIAKVTEKDDNTDDPLPAETLPIVNIGAVADDRTSVPVAIAQNEHNNSKRVLLSGSLSRVLLPAEKVVLYTGQTGAERAIGEPRPNGTTWTFALNDLDEGELNLKARVENAVGVKGDWGNEWTWVVDSVAPTASARVTSVEDNETPTLGIVAPGDITNDATPILRGSLTESLGQGENVVVFDMVNGQTTRLGFATVLANNTWEFQAALPSGASSHAFTAQVVDRAGNTGPANFESEQYVVHIDQNSAGFARADVQSVTDNQGRITGNVSNFGYTNDTTLDMTGNIVGTLNAGEQVVVYDGETLLGFAVIGENRASWTFSTELAEGPHLLRARVELAVAILAAAFR